MIKENEYKQRRKKFLKSLPAETLAIVRAAKPKVRSNDTNYPYRQNSNFYYLCGIEEEVGVLVFFKSENITKVYLFIQPKDANYELWNAKLMGVKVARKNYSFDGVYSIKKLKQSLAKWSVEVECFGCDFDDRGSVRLLKKFFRHTCCLYNVAHNIATMRLIKSQAEVMLIQSALAITKKAHHHAMRVVKDGMMEYQLQAEFEHIFKKNGAYSDAYTTIVAGGNNGNTLHYIQNNQPLKKGELVLIDAGCEYRYYASDITRTIPVDGKFTKEQKEIYTLVLNTQKTIISILKAGVLRSDAQRKTQELLLRGLIELGVVKGSFKKLLKKGVIKRYYPHSIGHYMGIDVHDQNPYKKGKKEIPLAKGMVVTVEPGLYFSSNDKTVPKRYRGIAVRIEDNILIGRKSSINLSKDILKEIEDIESMKQKQAQ